MSNSTPDQRPRVSICCPWYNRVEGIRPTLDSLLAQDYDSYEIIIINDGSTDPRVRETLDSYSDPRLRVIHQENTGFTVALRRAIEQARGMYIAIQGAGDISLPDRLRVQAEFLDTNDEAVAIGCVHEQVAARTGKHIALRRGEVEASLESLRLTVPFTHGTLMMRRRAYERAGGYDIAFRFCQDWDLYRRLVKLGRVLKIDHRAYQKLLFEDGATSNPRKRLQQIKYVRLGRLRDNDEEEYNRLRPTILSAGIDSVISHSAVINECRRSQVSLIKSGELAMAAEWSDIILEIDISDRVQRLARPILRFCSRVSVLDVLVGDALGMARSVRRLAKSLSRKQR